MQFSAIHENVKLVVFSSVIKNSQRTVFQLEGEGLRRNANELIIPAYWGFKSHPLHHHGKTYRGFILAIWSWKNKLDNFIGNKKRKRRWL